VNFNGILLSQTQIWVLCGLRSNLGRTFSGKMYNYSCQYSSRSRSDAHPLRQNQNLWTCCNLQHVHKFWFLQ